MSTIYVLCVRGGGKLSHEISNVMYMSLASPAHLQDV